MGRIQKALSKSRDSKSRRKSPVPIAEIVEPAHKLDISELPVIVPDRDSLERYRVVAAMPESTDRTAYKVLRTRLLQRLRASQFNVIGVTGAGIGEGKSLTAINLAYSIAQDVNHQVILADLDLRRPSLHEYLGIGPPNDLADVLAGTVPLEKALVCPNANRFAVLTSQKVQRDSSEVLASPEMANLIHQFRAYGPRTITVLDLPPVLASDDVIAVSPLIDAVLLVVAQGRCRRDQLLETLELLHETEVLGVVLNGSREPAASSGYYDYY